jgi:hypothetical protein
MASCQLYSLSNLASLCSKLAFSVFAAAKSAVYCSASSSSVALPRKDASRFILRDVLSIKCFAQIELGQNRPEIN